MNLKLENVTFKYDKTKTILDSINLSIKDKESVGIIGANGAGKTTLLKLIIGLYLNYNGNIYVDDTLVNKDNLSYIRETCGYIFQDSDNQLFMNTVYDDVAFGPRNYGYDEKEVETRVLDALDKTNTTHLKDKQIYKMSGGEKKLVSIATILSLRPSGILMDEPSIALDPKNRRKLIHVLNDLDCTKVIASHDLDFILDTCSRVIIINQGKIIADGLAKDILLDKELLEANNLELPLKYQQ